MKRFLIFLIVVAIAAGFGYVWWQNNASRFIQQQVRHMASGFFTDSSKLTVTNAPVKLLGLRKARVPKLSLSGENLVLKNGLALKAADVTLKDVDVTWPPFKLAGVGQGNYSVRVTDDAVTQFIQKRGIRLPGGIASIPLSSMNITFGNNGITTLRGRWSFTLPLLGKRTLPLTAHGTLVPAGQAGKVDLRIKDVSIIGLPFGLQSVKDGLAMVNPVIDVSDWPVTCDIKKIEISKGTAVFSGTTSGVPQSLLP